MYKIKGLANNSDTGSRMDSSLAIVNVVLLLIFFFVATGSLLASRGVEVALPDSTELPLDIPPEPLLIASPEGHWILNGEKVELGDLAQASLAFPTLHLLADRESNAAEVLANLAAENLIAVEIRLVTVRLRPREEE